MIIVDEMGLSSARATRLSSSFSHQENVREERKSERKRLRERDFLSTLKIKKKRYKSSKIEFGKGAERDVRVNLV